MVASSCWWVVSQRGQGLYQQASSQSSCHRCIQGMLLRWLPAAALLAVPLEAALLNQIATWLDDYSLAR